MATILTSRRIGSNGVMQYGPALATGKALLDQRFRRKLPSGKPIFVYRIILRCIICHVKFGI